MNLDELSAIGLDAEQSNRVLSLFENMQNELDAANSTILSLREAAEKFSGTDLGRLRSDFEALQNQYDTDILAARLNCALNTALLQSGAHDPRAVLPFIEMDKLSLDGEKIVGLDEQVSTLREEKSFLFNHPAPVCTGTRHSMSSPRFTNSRHEANAAIRAALGKN